MSLSASQHRKAVREGKIPDTGKREQGTGNRVLRPEARHSVLSPQYSVLNAEAVARRLAVCEPCEHRRVEGEGGPAGGRWLCPRSELPDFRCPRTMDLRRKAAVAEAVCYEGKWESVKSEE